MEAIFIAMSSCKILFCKLKSPRRAFFNCTCYIISTFLFVWLYLICKILFYCLCVVHFHFFSRVIIVCRGGGGGGGRGKMLECLKL